MRRSGPKFSKNANEKKIMNLLPLEISNGGAMEFAIQMRQNFKEHLAIKRI